VDLHQINKKLLEYDKTRITEKGLRQYIPITDYEEYYNIVVELVENNIITPVKNSGSNGMRPPLYKRYNIIKPECKYDEFIPEIRLLNDKLNIEGYLANPKKYKKHKPWLSPIDTFLKHNSQKLETPLSINERSFQIFSKEKALKEDKGLATVLKFNPGLTEVLNYYHTPEPFFTYNITNSNSNNCNCGKNSNIGNIKHEFNAELQGFNILIIENKDTWYTLKNIMSPNRNCLEGIKIDSLIYGEGKKIARKMDNLTEFDKSYFKAVKTSYYYFGDLDYEGIRIFHDLVNVNPMLEIKLMKALYIAMLSAAQGIKLPVTKEKQNRNAAEVDWFISFFDVEHQWIIKNILECDRYIPQEILNNGDFNKIIHK